MPWLSMAKLLADAGTESSRAPSLLEDLDELRPKCVRLLLELLCAIADILKPTYQCQEWVSMGASFL